METEMIEMHPCDPPHPNLYLLSLASHTWNSGGDDVQAEQGCLEPFDYEWPPEWFKDGWLDVDALPF